MYPLKCDTVSQRNYTPLCQLLNFSFAADRKNTLEAENNPVNALALISYSTNVQTEDSTMFFEAR